MPWPFISLLLVDSVLCRATQPSPAPLSGRVHCTGSSLHSSTGASTPFPVTLSGGSSVSVAPVPCSGLSRVLAALPCAQLRLHTRPPEVPGILEHLVL